MLAEFHAEQRTQSVDYVEVRLSPRRFLDGGFTLNAFLSTAHTFFSRWTDPVVRGILLVNRDSSDQYIDHIESAISAGGLPSSIVGLDLAGDERKFPESGRFTHLYASARAAGLGLTAHAGESGGPEQVWRAIDELGARRIGHGVSAGRSRSLLRRLAADQIMIEVSLGSSEALGAVRAATDHPLPIFIDCGVPVSFSTDTPINTGLTLADEMLLARRCLGVDEEALWKMQSRAAAFAFDSDVVLAASRDLKL